MQAENWIAINKNTLIGKFDLLLDSGIKISGIMLHESNGQKWLSFPAVPWLKNDTVVRDENGKVKYAQVISIPDRERRDKFFSLAIEAANKFLQPR